MKAEGTFDWPMKPVLKFHFCFAFLKVEEVESFQKLIPEYFDKISFFYVCIGGWRWIVKTGLGFEIDFLLLMNTA